MMMIAQGDLDDARGIVFCLQNFKSLTPKLNQVGMIGWRAYHCLVVLATSYPAGAFISAFDFCFGRRR